MGNGNREEYIGKIFIPTFMKIGCLGSMIVIVIVHKRKGQMDNHKLMGPGKHVLVRFFITSLKKIGSLGPVTVMIIVHKGKRQMGNQ
jgi:hypothetical protein